MSGMGCLGIWLLHDECGCGIVFTVVSSFVRPVHQPTYPLCGRQSFFGTRMYRGVAPRDAWRRGGSLQTTHFHSRVFGRVWGVKAEGGWVGALPGCPSVLGAVLGCPVVFVRPGCLVGPLVALGPLDALRARCRPSTPLGVG